MSELTNTVLRSDELSCPSCIGKVESKLNSMDGVASAEVKFASGRIIVEHDASKVTVRDLVDAVAEMGYAAKPSAV
ncbi:MAG: heavy-metal-associated domain-containing protein [Coriobacteriia bacterium]|nr:heavy-metal-associated domain-containing protein [Coriobacteriia bacterium]